MTYKPPNQGQGRDSRPGLLPEIFYGWWVVFASCIVMGYSSGIMAYSSTIFFRPVAESLGASRTLMSVAVSLGRVGGALEAPLVGYFIDKLGPRTPMRVGMALASTGLILFGLFTNSLLIFFLTWTGMVTLGFGSMGFAPAWAAINNWFVRKKGRAMGIGMSSQGMGGAILAPFMAYIIGYWGWQTAAVVAGIGVAVIVLPITTLIRTRPEEMGLKPDGDPETSPELQTYTDGLPQPDQSVVINFTTKQAVKTSTLWILVLAMGIRQFTQAGILLHLGPLLQDRGLSIIQAGSTVGLLALMSIPGAFTCGWISDHFQRRYVMTVFVVAETIALIILLTAINTWHIYGFVFIYGFGQGAHVINRAMLGEYFGQKNYGKIWGVVAMATTLLAWGQVYAGWIYDLTQSYNVAISTFILLHLISMVLYFNCRKPVMPDIDQ